MGPRVLLLLLLLLGLGGRGSRGSLPEELRVPLGSSILVQCHYPRQDLRAPKVWCRLSADGCRPLVSSAVDRTAPGGRRAFLTDLGGGLLQVEMIGLQEEDAGQYGCVVEGALGPQTVHTISLQVLPPVPGPGREGKEEAGGAGGLPGSPSSGPEGSASPWELGQQERSLPWIWGLGLLLGLLVAAVLLLAVLAKRKGSRRGAGGPRVPGVGPSMAVPHVAEARLPAAPPVDAPHVRLDSPPAFDNTTYANCPLSPPAGKPPPPPSPPLPPKTSSKPVTYATVVFPGGDKGGGASREPAGSP